MSATNDLLEAYAAWRHWTEAEADGIHAADWSAVAQCQEAKSALQPLIVQFTEAAQREWKAAGMDFTDRQRELRATVADLIALEQWNSETLARQRKACQNDQVDLARANQTLNRVHRSYGQVHSSAWQSYS